MIINLNNFIAKERPFWTELETVLSKIENDAFYKMDVKGCKRIYFLYQRISTDLVRVSTLAHEPQLTQYLESLLSRAYKVIYSSKTNTKGFSYKYWFLNTFPQTFRKHINAFILALIVTLAGSLFGGILVSVDSEAKQVIIPFQHLANSPEHRVEKEETREDDPMSGRQSSFSAYLMTNNIRVSILVLILGITFGIGTLIILFYNGVILGAVAADYILAGKSVFLAGWLLPHGSIEIPAILLAGQAGIMLAAALIGSDKKISFKNRLLNISNDLVTMIAGVSILLIWAGFIESFLSQYHEPVLPYSFKIIFGLIELFLLFFFLFKSGTRKKL